MSHDMSSDDVFELIEQVAAIPGKNDKIQLLKANADSDLLRRVLKMAYDPTISYGIKAVPDRTEAGTGEFSDGTWRILARLRDRILTGSVMQAAVQAEINWLGDKSSQLFRRILLKDMRAGFSAETTNKVFPGLVPDFPYMRCCLPKDTQLETFDWETGVVSQEKADGMFVNVNHENNGEIFLVSRQGSPFPMDKFDNLVLAVKQTLTAGTQSHGELLVLRDGVILPREIGNGILNSILNGGDFGKGEVPVVMLWDQIPLDAVKPKGKYDVPYRLRLRNLIKRLQTHNSHAVCLIPTRILKSIPEAYSHYAELLAIGKEGTIIKNPGAIWKDGTSKDQVKLKLEFVVELEIVGFSEGNGKNAATFGSILTRTSDGLLEVAVSGFKDKPGPGVVTRQHIHDNREAYLGTIMAVKANGIMKPSSDDNLHSLFLPRFVEFRRDKTQADTLPQVFAQEEAAKQGVAIAHGGI